MHIISRRHYLDNATILSPVRTSLPSYMTAGTASKLLVGFMDISPWAQQDLSRSFEQLGTYLGLLFRKYINADNIINPLRKHLSIAKVVMPVGKRAAYNTNECYTGRAPGHHGVRIQWRPQ